jgi:hypothetical protein
MVFMDFMLIAGNDWLVVPIEQQPGTLTWVDRLIVHDVFGDSTLVKRAEDMDKMIGSANQERPWTMFTLSETVAGDTLTDFLLLAPSAGHNVQPGPVLEEVHFLRDEMANIVWGIEHTIENAVGEPWPGHEREQAMKRPLPDPPEADDATLRYRIQTDMPGNWHPMMPVLASTGAASGSSTFQLELGSFHDPEQIQIEPAGRILDAQSASPAKTYRIYEEEVPRAGARVIRRVYRTRWSDGRTFVWVARERLAGAGEASSGLRFDRTVMP